jgi:glycosyltransferase involved in cell wall biosynthesis
VELLRALRTLAEDRSLCERLGAEGRAFVRERFSVERMVADTYRIYLRLLKEHGFLKTG